MKSVNNTNTQYYIKKSYLLTLAPAKEQDSHIQFNIVIMCTLRYNDQIT